MIDETTPQMGFIESIASRMAHKMNQDRNGDHIDYLKMKLGIETILINLSKGIVVYGVALVLGLLLETLILHLAYAALRRYSYGLHANSSVVCSLLSIVLFVGFPYLSQYVPFSRIYVLGVGLIFLALIFLYAPADTDKSPIIGAERRKSLRNKTLVTCSVIIVISLLIPNPSIRSLLMLGMATQIVMILPLTYKLFKRSVKNYEKYESA